MSTETVYAFCERVTATPTSPEHIRVIGPEGEMLGGGAPDTTLCGRPLHKGWDLPFEVTPSSVTQLAGQQYENGAYLLCPECTTAYRGPAS